MIQLPQFKNIFCFHEVLDRLQVFSRPDGYDFVPSKYKLIELSNLFRGDNLLDFNGLPNMRDKKFKWGRFTGIFASMGLLALAFNNCSGPFQTASSFNLSTITPNLSSNNPTESNLQSNFQCANQKMRGTGETFGPRLTKLNLRNSIEDIFPSGSLALLEPQFASLPPDEIRRGLADVSSNFEQQHAPSMLALATRASEIIVDDTPRRRTFVGDCSVQTPITDICVQQFIVNKLPLFFRRTVSAEEVALHLTSYKAVASSDGPLTALKVVIIRWLMAPDFLYRLENGGSIVDGRVLLTPFEVASRISFGIEGAPPDSALRQAALEDRLKTMEQLEAQALRLLAKPRTQARLRGFFNYYLATSSMQNLVASSGERNQISIDGLKEEMIQEALDFTNWVAQTKKGPFGDLFLSNATFARSDRLAKVYGVGKWIPGQPPVMAQNGRQGILMRATVLAINSPDPSIVKRGLHIRSHLLCQGIGAPPDDLVGMREEEVANLTRLQFTNRELIAIKTSPPMCMGCHSMLNPLGYALESLDELGQFRTLDVFRAPDGKVSSFPIDTRTSGLRLVASHSTADDDTVITPQDLAYSIANAPSAKACFARHLFRYFRGRAEAPEVDNCALADVEQKISAGESLASVFLKSFVNEDVFWKSAL